MRKTLSIINFSGTHHGLSIFTSQSQDKYSSLRCPFENNMKG